MTELNLDKETMILAIIKNARKPLPRIGKASRPERFCYYDRNGIGFGTMAKSEQELRDRWIDRQNEQMGEFARLLATMTPEELKSQYDYWMAHPEKGY